MRSFAKINPPGNSRNSLSLTDVDKSCQSREFLLRQICTLRLFAKIKFQKILNLQYLQYLWLIVAYKARETN